MKTQQIRNAKTLRALERAGFIKEPDVTFRPTGSKWGAGYSYVERTVPNDSAFTHKGRNFFLKYRDGSFFPYLFEIK